MYKYSKYLIIVFLSIFFNVSAQNLSDLTFGTDNTFEIMTWNIEEFPKNGATTVNAVKEVLEALQVDVICFQEIVDSTELKRIAANLDGYELLLDNGFWSGLALMYKADVVTVNDVYNIYDAPTYWNTFPRSPQVVEMTVAGEPIVVINNHLKCCGDGLIDLGNLDDEETRRLEANNLLKEFMDGSFPNSKVILIGDLNDMLTDAPPNNVFQQFLNDSTNFKFADAAIENGSSDNWSYPLWTSHLDHILISNEWFEIFDQPTTEVATIRIDDYLPGGLAEYDEDISDHRPVAMKLELSGISTSTTENIQNKVAIKVYPNPAKDLVQVNIDSKSFVSETIQLSIYNLYGALLASFDMDHSNAMTLDVSHFSSGTYLLKAGNRTSIIATQTLIIID
jgi:endonuclease/exonuclease/phosphatase family metal-dependent hydrolase